MVHECPYVSVALGDVIDVGESHEAEVVVSVVSRLREPGRVGRYRCPRGELDRYVGASELPPVFKTYQQTFDILSEHIGHHLFQATSSLFRLPAS